MHFPTIKNRGGSTGRDFYFHPRGLDDRACLRLSAEVLRRQDPTIVGVTATADWTDDEELRASLWLGRVVVSVGLRGRLARAVAERVGRPIDRAGSAESTVGLRLVVPQAA